MSEEKDSVDGCRLSRQPDPQDANFSLIAMRAPRHPMEGEDSDCEVTGREAQIRIVKLHMATTAGILESLGRPTVAQFIRHAWEEMELEL